MSAGVSPDPLYLPASARRRPPLEGRFPMSFPFHDQVLASVGSLASSAEFRVWLSGEASSDDDLIILNNSFIERVGLSSTKNAQWSVFRVAL